MHEDCWLTSNHLTVYVLTHCPHCTASLLCNYKVFTMLVSRNTKLEPLFDLIKLGLDEVDYANAKDVSIHIKAYEWNSASPNASHIQTLSRFLLKMQHSSRAHPKLLDLSCVAVISYICQSGCASNAFSYDEAV